MRESIETKISALLKREKQKHYWKRTVAMLMGGVVLCTAAALTLPASSMEGELQCGLEEHTHTEACYAEHKVLTCPLEDTSTEEFLASGRHVHTVACYEKTKVLSCGMEETPGHTHGPECYQMQRVNCCGIEEGSVHTHTEACYTEEEHLICPLEGVPEHVHTEDCYTIEKELICDKPEHTHTDACRAHSDDTADVETAAIWEATLGAPQLTGRWSTDLVTIANTQLGYTESTQNYRLDAAGEKQGYTRYGAWYGSPYGDWCAMFASFCMHYAQIPGEVVPQDANCESWRTQLDAQGLYQPADSYTPAVGDLIFFDQNGDGVLDHVGLVESLDYAEAAPAEEAPVTAEAEALSAEQPAPEAAPVPVGLRTIEGNAADQVLHAEYTLPDARIAGYGSIALAQERYEKQQAANIDPERLHPSFTYEDENLLVQLSVQGLTEPLPEDAQLRAAPITPDYLPDLLDEAERQAEQAVLDENHVNSGFGMVDLQLVSAGQRLTLEDTAAVQVEITFRTPMFGGDAAQQGGALHTFVVEPAPDSAVALLAETEAIPSDTTEAEAAATEEPEAEAAPVQVTAAPVEGSYTGVEQGVTGLRYQAKGLGPVAVLRTTQTQRGKFWKVCRDLNDPQQFTSGANYLIVSVEGNYALTNSGITATPVQLQPVKGNPDYYTVDNIPAGAIWNYEYNAMSGAYGGPTRAMKNGSRYLSPDYTQTLFVSRSEVSELHFDKSNNPACFNLWAPDYYNYKYYLNYNGSSGKFYGSTGQWQFGNQGSYQYARTSDMLILKQVDATLTIPDDAVAENGGDGKPGTATKPSYPAYVTPSGEKTGSFTAEGVEGIYVSDPATSQLESNFGNHPRRGKTDFEAQKVDDGKALLDKSVVYGHDDYGAFPEYADGTFGVTLSALGQAFVVDETTTKQPLDVLLILDMSNSMNETDKGQPASRAQILVEEVNEAVDNIMKANPENRVCAVGYNSGAYDLMELGHYEKKRNGNYFQYTVGPYNEFGDPRISIQATSRTGMGPNVPCENGTYTQLGIAQGYDLLMRGTPNPGDTTYTTTVNGESVTIPRKPVIILVSDGEPTHCTSHYMDVLNNPYYGDGLAPVRNGKAVQGYYTILSANYYKRMIGIHYNTPATMYTVAFGMKEEDYTIVDGSAATNHYRATVMNPTNANIDKLKDINTQYSKDIETPLYQMLKGSYQGGPQSVGASYNFTNLNRRLGDPHVYTPVLQKNPYQGNYAYADKAYLNNSSGVGLDAAFDEIIQLNTVYDFSYETQANKALTLTDPIGAGMEVKGEPVLRVNGVNYTPTGTQVQGNATVYQYTGVVPMDPYTGRTVDLSTILVRVETTGDLQTVYMEIPPKSLPTYTADTTMSFYHEALPLRLIYQVGLSASGQETLDALPAGETATFYTNRYTDGAHAGGTLAPSDKNAFYKKRGWKYTENKTANPTGTDGYSQRVGGSNSRVQYDLGNNGKLVLSRTVPPTQLTVQKKWLDYDGTEKTDALPTEITATLYRTYTGPAGQTVREDVVKDFTLTAENGWQRTFTPAELHEEPGRAYQYYVNEASVEGYNVSYTGDGVSVADPEHPILITNRYKYSDFYLPKTGGPGTVWFTGGGLALILGSLVYLYMMKRKNSAAAPKE